MLVEIPDESYLLINAFGGKISVVNYTIILVEVNEEILPPSDKMKNMESNLIK